MLTKEVGILLITNMTVSVLLKNLQRMKQVELVERHQNFTN